MPFNPRWEPSQLPKFETAWSHAVLPADGIIAPDDAARMMVIFQAMADELGDLVANAVYYEETCKYARDAERARAIRDSLAKSDRQREAEAALDKSVDLTEKVFIKAKAVRQFLDRKHDSAIRSHHALKALLRQANEERWLER